MRAAAFDSRGCRGNVDWPQSVGILKPADSEAKMRKKVVVICEMCGGTTPSCADDFLVFHCLAFCSPDCRDDYRAADEERRVRKHAMGTTASKPARHSRAA